MKEEIELPEVVIVFHHTRKETANQIAYKLRGGGYVVRMHEGRRDGEGNSSAEALLLGDDEIQYPPKAKPFALAIARLLPDTRLATLEGSSEKSTVWIYLQ